MSVLGLGFTISQAATISPAKINIVESEMIVMTQIFPTTNDKEYRKYEQYGRIFDKPLVRIPLEELPSRGLNQPRKKNQVFELATVFNDKLQQLIASMKPSGKTVQAPEKPATQHAFSSKKCASSKVTSKV